MNQHQPSVRSWTQLAILCCLTAPRASESVEQFDWWRRVQVHFEMSLVLLNVQYRCVRKNQPSCKALFPHPEVPFIMSESSHDLAPAPSDFEQLAAARRDWIESVLRVWCRQAPLKELRRAELEWFDIAGRADIHPTLWTWAWERFPDAVHSDLPGVHETFEVSVTLQNGTEITGFPDGRKSQRGMLVLVGQAPSGEIIVHEPISIDAVRTIVRISPTV